jgi:hypothetical protein
MVNNPDITYVYFYGAGCSNDEKKNIVKRGLQQAFPKASIVVNHDLLGSARALLGKETGFAAILGTGANTCIYDGKECVMNVDSLGYLLGDEGSGSYIGKKFVRDYMRNLLEPDLHRHFEQQFGITHKEDILKTLYSTQFPNRYLAGFCKFAETYVAHPYVRAKVKDAFRDFFKNLVSKYPSYELYSFNCVGSVGFVFSDILTEVALSYGMRTGKIIRSPIHDLVSYHVGN